MTKYLVSTTTHTNTGRQIDAWEGDYTEALNAEEAAADAAKWEAELLRSDGAIRVEIVGTTVFYEQDGEEYYKEIQVDEA